MWSERVGGRNFKIKTREEGGGGWGWEKNKRKGRKGGDGRGERRGSDEKFIVCTARSRDSFIKNIFPYSLSRSLTP